MKDKYLPIGTVVLLKGAEKRLMITGFCSMANDEDNAEMYDYSGCMYPEGIISSEETALFNHNQIEKIYYEGYSDDEDKEFKVKLINLLQAENIINPTTENKETKSEDIEYLSSIPPIGPGLISNINTENETETESNTSNEEISSTEQESVITVPPVGPGLPGYVNPNDNTDTQQ